MPLCKGRYIPMRLLYVGCRALVSALMSIQNAHSPLTTIVNGSVGAAILNPSMGTYTGIYLSLYLHHFGASASAGAARFEIRDGLP